MEKTMFENSPFGYEAEMSVITNKIQLCTINTNALVEETDAS